MAISTKKKNIIIAEWKTGAYTKAHILKKHKIDRKTLNKIISNIKQENAELVELCTAAESAKNSLQNPHEIKAIEEVIKNRLNVHTLANSILDGVSSLVKKGKVQKVLIDGQIVEYDLQASDYKSLADAVDKASLTLGVNQRHANNNIQVNTQNNLGTELVEVNEENIRAIIKEFIGE
jgi:hypothetical protein